MDEMSQIVVIVLVKIYLLPWTCPQLSAYLNMLYGISFDSHSLDMFVH